MSDNNFFRASAEDFKKIPGSPVAYWCTEKMFRVFSSCRRLIELFETRNGMSTTNNNLFLRMWHECDLSKCSFDDQTAESAKESGLKWFRYNKGGEFRRWYGNNCYLVNWKDDGAELKKYVADRYGSYSKEIRSEDRYFYEGVTWSGVTSSKTGFRYSPSGAIFDSGANGLFASTKIELYNVLGLLNSLLTIEFVGAINPTINTGSGTVGYIPVLFCEEYKDTTQCIVRSCVCLSQKDWDSYETSWDFAINPLVAGAKQTDKDRGHVVCVILPELRNVSGASDQSVLQIEVLYKALREKWTADCVEMRRLETENNRIFIEAYGLQDELTPEVPWNEITLTCNPFYRYGKKVKDEGEGEEGGGDEFPKDAELEARLQADTAKELISYAVGCMMGRYSLEKPGLILADQGACEADYYTKIGVAKENAKFQIDDDAVIPLLDANWFEDDGVTQFKRFLEAAFGRESLQANIEWIEQSIGKSIRDYFTKDFYKDHLQRYQNRPIYWLFSSPKGAFRALVYMHRYKPDMVGVVLQYLRSLQQKTQSRLETLENQIDDPATPRTMKTAAIREKTLLTRNLRELADYENDLYLVSTKRIEIDLDDGVKANYPKFGSVLRAVPALKEKGE